MKIIIGAAALMLLFSVPAHAQIYGSNVGSGGSLNSGTSLNRMGGLGGVTFHLAPNGPAPVFRMSVVSGDTNQFIPSTYVPFAKAVELGRAMEIAKPKSLAEVANEYRNGKKDRIEVTRVRVFEEQGSRREQ